MSAASSIRSPGGSGGPGRLGRVQSIRRPPPEGLTRCRTGRTAAPTRCPPRPSPRAFGRMSAPALPSFAPGPVPHQPAARRPVAEHRQLTGRTSRASHESHGSPRPPGGTVHWRRGLPGHPDKARWPDGHLSPKAVMTITGRHPVPVTHRLCPRGAHGPAPRPGRTRRSACALTGQHCGPFGVRRRRGPGHAHRNLLRPAGPGKRRLPAARRSHPAVTHDPRGASSLRCPCAPVGAKDPPVAACTAGSCRGRYHTGPRPGAPRSCGPVSL